jgi:sugar phosphate isomerase/epimerase
MISRYGGGFGPAEIEREIPRIEAAGFKSLQLEIFETSKIDLWEAGGAASLGRALSGSSLTTEVFVAHCLLNGLASAEVCGDAGWAESAERIAAISADIPAVQTVSIPLPPFTGDPEEESSRKAFLRQWKRLATPFVMRDLQIAIEVLPGSMGGTPERLEWLLATDEFADAGLNLDTGHFHAAGFDLPGLIRNHRIYATHICDNDGNTNGSHPPGEGTIPWSEVFSAIDANQYRGAWDLEIICDPEKIEEVYRNALNSCIALTREMQSVNTEGV